MSAVCRLLRYVTPPPGEPLPAELRAVWPELRAPQTVAQRLEALPDEIERARLAAAARDFEARALQLVRRDALPSGDLLHAIVLGPAGALELHGGRGGRKLRIDESLRLAALGRFETPWPARPDEAAVLARLGELLSVPLAPELVSFERLESFERPLGALVRARLVTRDELGWALGRYEAIEVLAHAHLVLLGPRRRRARRFDTLPQAAPGEEIELGALEPPPVGAPGTGPPPAGGARSPRWSAEDDARLAFCRAVAERTAEGDGSRLELDAAGEALDERIDLGLWRSGRYDEEASEPPGSTVVKARGRRR
ncbi:MAG: hypothetical protein D6776_11940 [Planctomycetota bacterium]|nr:MAG: hypothetical protein D6776_11940 [Planctomycetota bacterium]